MRGRIESVLDCVRIRGARQGENLARWEGNLAGRLLIEEDSEVTNLQRSSFPVGTESTLEVAGTISGANDVPGTGGTGSGGVAGGAAGGAGGKAIVGIANVDLSEFTGSIIGRTS